MVGRIVEARWTPAIEPGAAAFAAPATLRLRPSPGSTYPELIARLALLLTDEHGPGTLWEVLTASLPDRPVTRAVRFWARYGPELGVETGEDAARIGDGTVAWAGARPLVTVDETLRAWRDERRLRFKPRFLLAGPGDTAASLIAATFDSPSGPGYAEPAWLAGFTGERNGAIVLFDETERHEPCAVLSGARERLEPLRLAISD